MKKDVIELAQLKLNVFNTLDKDWMLLTAGDFEQHQFNMMTVSWGTFGIMWHKPIAMVVVRPQRYTHEFTEKYSDFTISAFPPEYRSALNVCGTVSGRNVDKLAQTGLHATKACKVTAPGYEEACLVIECHKIYFDQIRPEHFLAQEIAKNYPQQDYHTFYFGEIVCVQGTAAYRQ